MLTIMLVNGINRGLYISFPPLSGILSHFRSLKAYYSEFVKISAEELILVYLHAYFNPGIKAQSGGRVILSFKGFEEICHEVFLKNAWIRNLHSKARWACRTHSNYYYRGLKGRRTDNWTTYGCILKH